MNRRESDRLRSIGERDTQRVPRERERVRQNILGALDVGLVKKDNKR